MKKILDIVLKVVLSLILALPILGTFGILGEPTRDLYHTDEAFAFIQMLTQIMYINYMMVVVHILALIALWTKREALAALLVAPITANIVGFHLFLDGGLFTAGAIMVNVMLAINLYLVWKYRSAYQALLQPRQIQ
jgi:hypothetical protein